MPGPARRRNAAPAKSSSPRWITTAQKTAISVRKELLGEDVLSLQELLTYGLKGTAAYAHHALVLGQEAHEVYAYFAKALSAQ
ncbi:MAG: hydroxylamine reductase, partial [Rikenellaceae bacterium]|nr:hydroxylamine reductase [Rikenellaceae bacterium]